MKWNKFGKVALMVLTVAFIVQAGMRLWWPPPEKARAESTTIYVSIIDVDDLHFIEGIDPDIVHFHLYDEFGLLEAGPADAEDGGVYSYTADAWPTEFLTWDVSLDPPPEDFEFPVPACPNPSIPQSSSSTTLLWYIDDTNNP